MLTGEKIATPHAARSKDAAPMTAGGHLFWEYRPAVCALLAITATRKYNIAKDKATIALKNFSAR